MATNVEEPVAEADEDYSVEISASLVERKLHVLKSGDAFAVFDNAGDVTSGQDSPEGLYFRDTRHLSRWAMRIEGQPFLLLSSTMQDDNAALSVDLSNPKIHLRSGEALARDTIALTRTKYIWEDQCHERLALRNYGSLPAAFRLGVYFEADFRDLFEVRGSARAERGSAKVGIGDDGALVFSYLGLDETERCTAIRFWPWPTHLDHRGGVFSVFLNPGEQRSILLSVALRADIARTPRSRFVWGYAAKRRTARRAALMSAEVTTSDPLINQIFRRSTSDIQTLTTVIAGCPYPYAGIPWYNTVFGRDGIITAILYLWADPSLAKGVLLHLASTQSKVDDPDADAQPGKILHESRQCEMAILREVPFKAYYGTVDATPLFVVLAGLYLQATGDLQTIASIWPSIEASLRWCDEFGDLDYDGFVEYFRETPFGLANQGWKDSHDSIFHADGAPATGPIALVEVQAYVFAAKRAGAEIARRLGEERMADDLSASAEVLKEKFEAEFWDDRLGSYVLALDGAKRPCAVQTSNAGHTLFAGIAGPERAARLVAALFDREMFSGWGVRTVSAAHGRFNPMSYHNGSIWPHDNALIALGLANYGFKQQAATLFEAICAAAGHDQNRRLPELFCGFRRRAGRGPVPYPVACSPQAWSAASPFALLGAALGLRIEHAQGRVAFHKPRMPKSLDRVHISRLPIGQSRIDVVLSGKDDQVSLDVTSREDGVDAIILK